MEIEDVNHQVRWYISGTPNGVTDVYFWGSLHASHDQGWNPDPFVSGGEGHDPIEVGEAGEDFTLHLDLHGSWYWSNGPMYLVPGINIILTGEMTNEVVESKNIGMQLSQANDDQSVKATMSGQFLGRMYYTVVEPGAMEQPGEIDGNWQQRGRFEEGPLYGVEYYIACPITVLDHLPADERQP